MLLKSKINFKNVLISELGKKSNASAIRKCNLQIKIGSKSSKEEDNKEEGEIGNQKADEEARPWNLRPRNAKTKIDKEVYGGEKSKAEAQSSSRRGGKEVKEEREKGEKKNKKMTINVALTKEEIEDDIFAMTGAKPSRRPQRRPKNVQKQLDVLTFLPSIIQLIYLISCGSLTYLIC